MKFELALDEIEAVLEKIWDIHDKLSDTIHSINSRSQFNNININNNNKHNNDEDYEAINGGGFVFVKEFNCESSTNNNNTIEEAKSLNSIRTAFENLEHHLQFLQTVETNQRAERDSAIARLEQSRIILALRLSEHHGKNYKVIQEALAFVGNVQDAGRFVSPENLYGRPETPSAETMEGKRSNALIKFLVSSFNFVKTSLQMDNVGGILGNAAMFAVSMITLLHLHQVACKQHEQKHHDTIYGVRNVRRTPRLESSSYNHLNHLDVTLARG
ncbi:hypothetical protein ACFE04_027549 [Oxalis oulophora]